MEREKMEENKQTRITDPDGEELIMAEDAEKAKKTAKEKQEAINRAQRLILDARARYVKEKTRARSKKAAEEREAILQSPRFKVLEQFDRFEDIQESYGWDYITEDERDRYEELWEEREELRNHTDNNGIYVDLVTKALAEAETAVLNLWEEEIDEAEALVRKFNEQRKQADEELREWKIKKDEEYRRITGEK